jgi:hypothetical protein
MTGCETQSRRGSRCCHGSGLLDRAQSLGIRAAFVAGDEVYGGRQLRRGIRQRAMGYVMAVRAHHAVTTGPGRTMAAPPPAPRPPSPPALECLRRDNTMITTNYSCRSCLPKIEIRATTTVLTAFRTTVSPNRIPPPVVIAALTGVKWRAVVHDATAPLHGQQGPASRRIS